MADPTDPFLAAMHVFIGQRQLLSPGERVLLAVSGGADSLALAAAMLELNLYDLHVAHVNHRVRPDAADDAQFVRRWAEERNLPCHVETIDVPELARQKGLGIEEACRIARYDALIGLARRLKLSAIAVAHHRDDQVETVLHRIFRGTHLRGLSGMAARRQLGEGTWLCGIDVSPMGDTRERGRDAPATHGQDAHATVEPHGQDAHATAKPSLWLVRPLLWAGRAEIEEFCRRRGLAWRTDSTNQHPDYTRNFIRLSLLPLLREKINPRVDEAVLRLSLAAAEAEETLETLAKELLERALRKSFSGRLILRISPLRKAGPVLTRMALRLAVERLGAPQKELSQERFDDLLAVAAGERPAADLPGGLRAGADGKNLTLDFAAGAGGCSGPPESLTRMEKGFAAKGED